MPGRTPSNVMDLVWELARANPSQAPSEIQKIVLEKLSYELSRGPIDRVLFAVRSSLGLTVNPGPRPGFGRGGRPHGSKDSRPRHTRKWSPNRTEVIRLRRLGMSDEAIGQEIGLTRQGVARIRKTIPESELYGPVPEANGDEPKTK